MALYIQFSSKETGEVLPLNRVDEILCEKLGRAVHPTKWVDNWFNFEGLALATGDTIEQLIEDFPDRKIASLLNEHFTWETWFSR